MKEIEFYKLENGKEPVRDWLLSLDNTTRVKIIKDWSAFMMIILATSNSLHLIYTNFVSVSVRDTGFITQ